MDAASSVVWLSVAICASCRMQRCSCGHGTHAFRWRPTQMATYGCGGRTFPVVTRWQPTMQELQKRGSACSVVQLWRNQDPCQK